MNRITLYIIVMALTTFLVRVIPILLIRKEIKNVFVKSFLYYVPYVTLSVMTFPAIIQCTNNPIAGAAALAGGIIAAWKKVSMFLVALICCALVLILEFVL